MFCLLERFFRKLAFFVETPIKENDEEESGHDSDDDVAKPPAPLSVRKKLSKFNLVGKVSVA